MVTITVDDKPLQAPEGSRLLAACLAAGIYIPHLCHVPGVDSPPASCRLCFVAIQGQAHPVTACTVTVADGMVVQTDTPAVRRLQRSGFRLLMSAHQVECCRCPANRACALQHIARFLDIGLRSRPYPTRLKDAAPDTSHPFLVHFPNRCVLCGRCIHVCRERNGASLLAFSHRGFDTVISAFGATGQTRLPCESCSACVAICPVGALSLKSDLDPDQGD
jgi:bidirectional [NiFe] hydrogenase diaphorase subunit